MFRRFHRPVTHAASLWILVGMAAGMFVATMAYVSLLAGIRDGVTKVFPPKSGTLQAEQMPSLFGTVRSVEADGLTVDSKQAFKRVLVDEGTSLTTVGGAVTTLGEIRPGAVVTATGRDSGGGVLSAVAVVVLEQGSGEAKQTSLLGAPVEWSDWWKTLPPLIAWAPPESEFVAAVRGYSVGLPAVSVELYGKDGKIDERLELDVPGYGRMKPLNPYMKPEEAEERLKELGIGPGGTHITANTRGGLYFKAASGEDVQITSPDPARQNGMMLGINEVIGLDDIGFLASFPDASLAATYDLSPDKKWLLAAFTAPHPEFGPFRSVHLIRLSDLQTKDVGGY